MEQLGAIITALAGLFIAVGGFLAQRNKSVRISDKQVVADNKRISRQFRESLRHTHHLESLLAKNGILIPERPDEMDPMWGIEEDEQRKVGKK